MPFFCGLLSSVLAGYPLAFEDVGERCCIGIVIDRVSAFQPIERQSIRLRIYTN